ncbi:hypothetical protein Tco_1286432 [Tanacetum coccineum]
MFLIFIRKRSRNLPRTPFDQATLDEYDQKDKLFQMMRKSISYNKHPAHKALFDSLTLTLNSAKEKKKRKQQDYESSKKDKDQAASSKKEDDRVDAENPSQADASVPTRDNSTWFKHDAVEIPESPDP